MKKKQGNCGYWKFEICWSKTTFTRGSSWSYFRTFFYQKAMRRCRLQTANSFYFQTAWYLTSGRIPFFCLHFKCWSLLDLHDICHCGGFCHREKKGNVFLISVIIQCKVHSVGPVLPDWSKLTNRSLQQKVSIQIEMPLLETPSEFWSEMVLFPTCNDSRATVSLMINGLFLPQPINKNDLKMPFRPFTFNFSARHRVQELIGRYSVTQEKCCSLTYWRVDLILHQSQPCSSLQDAFYFFSVLFIIAFEFTHFIHHPMWF